MSEMIERVARAICLSQFGDETIHAEARCCQAGGTDGCCIEAIYPDARAAIEAMREPTTTMERAAWDDAYGRYDYSVATYTVMIDAAFSAAK